MPAPSCSSIAQIEDASGTATHIVCSPQTWADLSKFKTATDSNVSLVGAGTTAAVRTLLSVPVLVSNSIPDGTMLVLDRNSVLSVHGSVQLATSDQFYFHSDNIGVRATWRFGAKIADTARVVKLTVTPGAEQRGRCAATTRSPHVCQCADMAGI